MTTVISDIVLQVSQEEQGETQRRQAKYQELLDAARLELRKVLDQVDGLYDVLSLYLKEDYELKGANSRDLAVDLEWKIQSDDLQLAPMQFNVRLPNQGYHTCYINVYGYSFEFVNIRNAIATANSVYADWKEKEDAEFIQERSGVFNFRWQGDEEKMLAAYNELVARLPDRKAQWDLWVKQWTDTRADCAQKEQAQKEYDQKRKIALQERQAHWISYFAELKRVQELNAAKALELQDLLDQPFTAWQLVYGLVADEDGEAYVTTNEVWVRYEKPGRDGMFELFNGEKVKYFHPVSIRPQLMKPTERIGPYRSKIWTEYGIELTFQVDADRAHIDELVANAGFVKLPGQPKRPGIINWSEDESIRRKASRIVDGEVPDEDDVPF